MPSFKTIAQMAGVTLGVLFIANNVPQIGQFLK